MYTLRQAIHERLAEINEERRNLADERKELFEMLRGLEQGAGTVDTSSVLQTMNTTVQALSELVPQVPASVVIHEIARKMEANGIHIEGTPVRLEAVTEAANEARLQTPTNKRHYSVKEVGGIIVSYLREHGGRSSTMEIKDYLVESFGLHYKDWSQAFWSVRNADSRLKKAGRGYIKLVEGETPSEAEKAAHGSNMDE